MRRSTSALALGFVLALTGALRADDDASDAKLRATVENTEQDGQPCGRFVAEGTLPFLPTGAILHVTLQVLDRSPPVEAAVLKIDVGEGGTYRVEMPWPGQRFGALGYEVRVNLHMDAQPAKQKLFLSRQLGYRGDDHVMLASRPIHLGTVDERLAFAREVLIRLREHNERVSALHARLVAAKGQQGDAWKQAMQPIMDDYLASYEEYRTWVQSYVVWFEHANVGLVDQCYRGLEAAMAAKTKSNQPKLDREMTSIRDVVERVRTDIDSRLPKNPPPAGEKG